MVIDIVFNIAMLLSLSIVYTTHNLRLLKVGHLKHLLMGVVIGIVGVLIMRRPFVYQAGIFFDSRSILLGVSGMFFGFITTLIASLIMVVYRIHIGGNGTLVGALIILCSMGVGTLWHRLRFKKVVKEGRYSRKIEFLLVGLITHVLVLLILFFIEKGDELTPLSRLPLGNLSLLPPLE